MSRKCDTGSPCIFFLLWKSLIVEEQIDMFMFSSLYTFQCKRFLCFSFKKLTVLLQKPFEIKQIITTQLYHYIFFALCLLGSVGKTKTKGFICIYSSELVCRSPNWPSRGILWKRSIPIPWAGRETGVVCSPCKPLDHGRLSHNMGQEPLAFLKRTWTKVAPTVKEKWQRNGGEAAEPSHQTSGNSKMEFPNLS